jgi:hypothetical protein
MRKTSIAFLTVAALLLVSAARAQNRAPARYIVIDLGALGGVFGIRVCAGGSQQWLSLPRSRIDDPL